MILPPILITVIKSFYTYCIYPFLLGVYDSIALWRCVKYIIYSKELQKLLKHTILLNGVGLLGSVLVYRFVFGPMFHLILHFGTDNSDLFRNLTHLSEFSSNVGDTAVNIAENRFTASLTDNFSLYPTTEAILEALFHTFWTVPILLASQIANGQWYGKIVKEINSIREHGFSLKTPDDNNHNNQKLQKKLEVDTNLPIDSISQRDLPQIVQNQSGINTIYPDTNQDIQNQQKSNPSQQILRKHLSILRSKPNPYPLQNSHTLQTQHIKHEKRKNAPDIVEKPLKILTLIADNLNRIIIFLILLIQAVILAIIPGILTKFMGNTYFARFLGSFPLSLSYALSAIAYTYTMFEYTWLTPSPPVTLPNDNPTQEKNVNDPHFTVFGEFDSNDEQLDELVPYSLQHYLLTSSRAIKFSKGANRKDSPHLSPRTLSLQQLSLLNSLYNYRDDVTLFLDNTNDQNSTTSASTNKSRLSSIQSQNINDFTLLSTRFTYTEYRAMYFVGFSIIITALTFDMSLLLSLSIFNLLFPLFLMTSLFATGHVCCIDLILLNNYEQHRKTTDDSSTITIANIDKKTQSRLSDLTQDIKHLYEQNNLSSPIQFPVFSLARWFNNYILAKLQIFFTALTANTNRR